MGITTNISWASATWNAWQGCHKVSAGCTKCYMFREKEHYGQNPNKVVRSSDTTFNAPLKWQKQGKLKEGSRIFVCSWSDFFIEEADQWRPEAWEIMKKTPEYIYIIVTKRPGRISAALPDNWKEAGYQNVWLLVSAENQEQYEKRWRELSKVQAKIKGVSIEPMLEPMVLRAGCRECKKYLNDLSAVCSTCSMETIRPQWIITGGESDFTAARTIHPNCFLSIKDDCQEYGIPYFHKQNGGTKIINGHWGGNELEGKIYQEFPC